jgi:hypothetical protein
MPDPRDSEEYDTDDLLSDEPLPGRKLKKEKDEQEPEERADNQDADKAESPAPGSTEKNEIAAQESHDYALEEAYLNEVQEMFDTQEEAESDHVSEGEKHSSDNSDDDDVQSHPLQRSKSIRAKMSTGTTPKKPQSLRQPASSEAEPPRIAWPPENAINLDLVDSRLLHERAFINDAIWDAGLSTMPSKLKDDVLDTAKCAKKYRLWKECMLFLFGFSNSKLVATDPETLPRLALSYDGSQTGAQGMTSIAHWTIQTINNVRRGNTSELRRTLSSISSLVFLLDTCVEQHGIVPGIYSQLLRLWNFVSMTAVSEFPLSELSLWCTSIHPCLLGLCQFRGTGPRKLQKTIQSETTSLNAKRYAYTRERLLLQRKGSGFDTSTPNGTVEQPESRTHVEKQGTGYGRPSDRMVQSLLFD